MASVATAIVGGLFGNGGGALFDGAAKMINAIKGQNPEDAAALQALITKHSDLIVATQADLEKAKIQENVSLNQIASDNVKADADGKSWMQRNDRPAIIWMGIAILLVNYMFGFFMQKWGFKPLDFPSIFWETWAILATGVVFNRTAQTTLGGAGGTVKLPGIHLESKGD